MLRFYLTNRKERIDPQQEITLFDGRKITFGDLQGKPLLVVFWATSSTTCVEEMPKLAEFNKKGTTEILAVAVQYDDFLYRKKYVSDNKYNFKFTYDRDNMLSNIFNKTKITTNNI